MYDINISAQISETLKSSQNLPFTPKKKRVNIVQLDNSVLEIDVYFLARRDAEVPPGWIVFTEQAVYLSRKAPTTFCFWFFRDGGTISRLHVRNDMKKWWKSDIVWKGGVGLGWLNVYMYFSVICNDESCKRSVWKIMFPKF